MRLIDADELIKRLEKWNTPDSTCKALYNFAMNRVIEQPTAYDVDEVAKAVEEITERISNTCDEIELDWPEEERTGYDMNEDILKIRHLVKHGCIETDDVCEWRKRKEEWESQCDYYIEEKWFPIMFQTTLDEYYCPYCGKKIKVVE